MKTTWLPCPQNWEKLKHHPFACIVGFGEGIDVDALASHMRVNKYDETEPIVLFRADPKQEWRILSGRHRHQAAILANQQPHFKALEGTEDDARQFAMKDALRRHLSPSQRALIIATLNVRAVLLVGQQPQTQSELAKKANVAKQLITDAVKVVEKGTKKLQAAVGDNTLSVQDAAKIVNADPSVQNQAVADVKAGKAKTAAQSARKPGKNGQELPALVTYISKIGALVRDLDLIGEYGGKKNSDQRYKVQEQLEAFKRGFESFYRACVKGKS